MAAPVLDLTDIQAQFGGFDRHWPVGRFWYLRWDTPDAGRALLARLPPLAHCLHLDDSDTTIAVNVAFTHRGLAALGLDPTMLDSFPEDFRQGMRARAPLNGDTGPNDPQGWDDAWQGGGVHGWVGAYARSAQALGDFARDFEAWLSATPHLVRAGGEDVSRFYADPARPMHIDDPASNPTRPVVLEHFGFRDGVSNPPVAGMPQDGPATGIGMLNKDGSWSPLPAGEFLLGQVDVDGEVPPGPQPEALARNGSFMVLRKLAQDVDGFRAYVAGVAASAGIGADALAARFFGRHRDGTPLADPSTLNGFTFGDDPQGRRCPLGAHLRRANPRDSMGFGTVLVDRHRILRNGITYGRPVPHGVPQAAVNGDAGQGLMFIAFNTSFAGQFEFVTQQWLNFGNDQNQGNDRDPVVGVQVPPARFVVPGDGLRPTVVCAGLPQFVRLRGGDYFFLPGIAAVAALAAGAPRGPSPADSSDAAQ
jgi:Dyp-type peroxidase family